MIQIDINKYQLIFDAQQIITSIFKVSMGIYAAVLHALNNIDKDLLLVAKDDVMGRKIQDLNLTVRKRAARRDD